MHKARLVRAEYRQRLLQPELRDRIIEVLEEWLQAIWDGTANYRLPEDNQARKVSPDDADNLIEAIMDWYQNEFSVNQRYWNEQGIYEIPDYTQIQGRARIAFVQDLYRAIMDFS